MKKSLVTLAAAGLFALAVQTAALADDGVCPCQVAIMAGEPKAKPMPLGNAGPSVAFVAARPQPVKAVLARLRVAAKSAKIRSFFRPKP